MMAAKDNQSDHTGFVPKKSSPIIFGSESTNGFVGIAFEVVHFPSRILMSLPVPLGDRDVVVIPRFIRESICKSAAIIGNLADGNQLYDSRMMIVINDSNAGEPRENVAVDSGHPVSLQVARLDHMRIDDWSESLPLAE